VRDRERGGKLGDKGGEGGLGRRERPVCETNRDQSTRDTAQAIINSKGGRGRQYRLSKTKHTTLDMTRQGERMQGKESPCMKAQGDSSGERGQRDCEGDKTTHHQPSILCTWEVRGAINATRAHAEERSLYIEYEHTATHAHQSKNTHAFSSLCMYFAFVSEKGSLHALSHRPI
jgi:hypothetical protein